jgi:PAS domain S-box-containing protein
METASASAPERTGDLQNAADDRLAHLHFLESLDRVNRAMQGSNDLEEMVSDVLDAMLSIFDSDRAGIAYAESGAPIAQVLMVRSRPGFALPHVVTEGVPTYEAFARFLPKVLMSTCPLRFDAQSDPALPETNTNPGARAALVVALHPKGEKPYLLYLVQCSYARVWKEEEERLFQEIGRRMTDGLTTLLMFRNLRLSEARLAEAQRIAHVAYWERDTDTDRVTWSDEAYRIFGLEPHERPLSLSAIRNMIHPEDRPRMGLANDTAVAGGPRYDVEYRVVRPDGEVRIVHSQGDVVRDETGRARRIFGTVQDITERRQAEELLRETQAELARVTRVTMLGEITASIAHEINQPLTAVVMNSNACRRWLAADPPQIDEARKAAAHAIDDAERAGKIIHGIRAIMKRDEWERHALEVNDMIRDAVEAARSDLERKNVVIRTELTEGLPGIRGDRVQLQQVLINLLVNAGDAMEDLPDEQRTLTVRSRGEDSGDVLVEVNDRGKGIEPAQAARVFEAFFTTKATGLGMGLAISRSIVEAHGGRIWATSNNGSGTSMSFVLPVASSA